jgi:hypothetical protein
MNIIQTEIRNYKYVFIIHTSIINVLIYLKLFT